MLPEDALERVIAEIIAGWDVPGLAVGIVLGDETIYAKGFGVQSLETGVPVTLDSVFCVQSVSKCFVATAVMQLVERGILDLEAPLVEYLPYFRLVDPHSREITLRQVLSHTSGMPDMDEIDYVELVTHPEDDAGAAERYVRSLSGLKFVAAPGKEFHYSNIAYNVLGDLLAKVTGRSFEDTLRENLLLPAGMPNSTFLLADVPADLLAVPHLRSPGMQVNPRYPYHRADAPASFLHSTVVELCHWASAALQRGRFGEQRFLSPAGFDLMWKPVARRGTLPGLYEAMGLGWTLGHYQGARTVSHGGSGFGGTAFLLILPDENAAAVILCNEESDACARVTQAVADILLGEKPQAGAVSWLVPISRAWAKGGRAAAAACAAEIKARNDGGYYRDEEALLNLALELYTAGQIVLALEALEMNLQEYPGTTESQAMQARIRAEFS
jgi:CubicO group peptidase (beta-lactamase class C family)